MRLATRLSLVTCLVTLGSGLATAALVASYTLRTVERRMLSDVGVVVSALAPALTDAILSDDPVVARELLSGLVSESHGLSFAYVVGERGDVMAHSFEKVPDYLPGTRSAPSDTRDGSAAVRFRDRGISYMIGGYPLVGGTNLGTVHVGIDRAVFAADVRRMWALVMAMSVLVAAVGVVVSVFASRRVTRPLSQLTDSLVDFGGGKVPPPVSVTGGEEVGRLAAAFREMTESRNRAEEALHFQKALLEAESEAAPDGILIISPERKVLYRNRRFLQMWSISDSRETSDEALLAAVLDRLADPEAFLERVRYLYAHPDDRCKDDIALKDGQVFERHTTTFSDPAGRLYGRIWFFRDITERRRAEEERVGLERQMLHAQKLESLGVLAGGIAHDFNNILMAIIGNAELALMRLSRESPAVDNLRRIETAATRAADLAKQMLAYSGKGHFVIERIDVNRLLEEMLHMLEVSISKGAALCFALSRPLPAVEADATQIRQVVMNLVINASEALGERGGVISIGTGSMSCDQEYLATNWLQQAAKPGPYVWLEVADTGCGMDQGTVNRIFDPFFTTKFTGRGLGMAAVQGIVRGHRGAIKVYSEPGRGTSVKILLPAAERVGPAAPDPAAADQGIPWRGSGTVLLVDDEEIVRDVGAEMLRALGFAVITAHDGDRAVEIAASRADLSLVLLDLTMPGMDGVECFRQLRARAPQLQVVMSSGYNEQEVRQQFVGKALAGFVQKPYTLAGLRRVLRELRPDGAPAPSAKA